MVALLDHHRGAVPSFVAVVRMASVAKTLLSVEDAAVVLGALLEAAFLLLLLAVVPMVLSVDGAAEDVPEVPQSSAVVAIAA